VGNGNLLKTTYVTLIFIVIFASQSIVQALSEPASNAVLIDSNGAGGSLALDSNGNPHVVFSHWNYARNTNGATTTTSRIDYAVWTGSNWDIQTVDPSGTGGWLKLDSGNRPQMIYASGSNVNYFFKYAVLNGGAWNIQTIDSSEWGMQYSMALDSAGNPHIIYTTYHYSENYGNVSSTQDIKYAYYNGVSWAIQTIEKAKTSVGYNTLSIAIDSKGNPQVLYLEAASFPYPRKNAVGGFSFLGSYNVKYASLSDNLWQSQTVFTNSTSIGNLVLNSDGQPSFCYEHDVYSVKVEYGSYGVNATNNYGFWDGQEWVSRPIYSDRFQSGKTFLHLDTGEDPQVFFYLSDYQNSNNSGLMYAHWTGSNWNLYKFENIVKNSYLDAEYVNIVDMAFDSQGNPVLTADGIVGTIGGASVIGDLTYVSLGTLLFSSFADSWIIIIPIAIAVIVALICLLIILKRKKKSIQN
jgi:hypothetical protein